MISSGGIKINKKKKNTIINIKKRKTAFYIRVSTDRQAEEGYSVLAQQRKLLAFAAMKDIENYEFYIDPGYTGSNLDRPEMQRLINDIENGLIEAVVVFKLDRLSRSQLDVCTLLETVFTPNDVDFVSLTENFDTGSPYGKAMVGLLSVFSQLERENIFIRTRMGMEERIKKGLWRGGGGVPTGYDYDKVQGILVPNNRAQDIREIFDLYLAGVSPYRLAELYGFKSDSAIRHILANPVYIGMIKYKDKYYRGLHEPIVSEEVFEAVQRMMKLRSTPTVTESKYLLTGMITCGCCGAKMRYQKWGKGLKIYCYSQTKSKAYLVKDPDCANPRYDAALVEELVVQDFLNRTDAIILGMDTVTTETQITNVDALIKAKNDHIQKQKRLYLLYADTGDEVLLETIEEIKLKIQRLDKAIEDEKKERALVNQKAGTVNELSGIRQRWESLTTSQKRRVLQEVIERIVLDGSNVNVTYKF